MPPALRTTSAIKTGDFIRARWYHQLVFVNADVGESRPADRGSLQHPPMDDPATIGARIRQARISKQLTQADLAAAIGVVRSHLTNVENGKDSLGLDKLGALATEMGTSVAWLIGEGNLLEDARIREIVVAFQTTDEQGRNLFVRLARSLAQEAHAESLAASKSRTAGTVLPMARSRSR